jgi:hypothetical protein
MSETEEIAKESMVAVDVIPGLLDRKKYTLAEFYVEAGRFLQELEDACPEVMGELKHYDLSVHSSSNSRNSWSENTPSVSISVWGKDHLVALRDALEDALGATVYKITTGYEESPAFAGLTSRGIFWVLRRADQSCTLVPTGEMEKVRERKPATDEDYIEVEQPVTRRSCPPLLAD